MMPDQQAGSQPWAAVGNANGLRFEIPGSLSIYPNRNFEGKNYCVTRYVDEKDAGVLPEYVVSSAETRKLEAYLIGNPLFSYVGDVDSFE